MTPFHGNSRPRHIPFHPLKFHRPRINTSGLKRVIKYSTPGRFYRSSVFAIEETPNFERTSGRPFHAFRGCFERDHSQRGRVPRCEKQVQLSKAGREAEFGRFIA